jgi:hypothetical protein
MSVRRALRCPGCGVELAEGRELRKCQPCHNLQVKKWRANMAPLRATSEYPGVDIDAVHRSPRPRVRA